MRIPTSSALLLCALATPAHAQSFEAVFSPLDLATGELYLPDTVALEEMGALAIEVVGSPGRCEVAAAGNVLYSNGPGTCPMLWAMADLKPLKLRIPLDGKKVDVTLTPQAEGRAPALNVAGSAIAIPTGFPEIGQVAVLIWDGAPPKPIAWELRPLEDGRVELGTITAEVAKKAGGRFLMAAWDPTSEDEPRALVWQVAATPTSNTPTTPTSNTPTPTPSSPPRPAPMDEGEAPPPPSPDEVGFTLQAFPPGEPIPPELKCPPRRLPQDNMIVVCVDATGPTIRYWQSPRTQHTKPNRPFFVHVVHRIEHRAQILLSGTPGSYAPGSRGNVTVSSDDPGDGFNLEGDERGKPVTYVVTARTFAPRLPGFTPMEVRILDGAGQLVSDPFKLEYLVEATYSGAFRVGVAGILLGALDQRYRSEQRPGSGQSEIVASDESAMDLDVVLGYSPYLDEGGRPGSGCESAPFCFNPYFGLGLLSASGDGELQWLKSVHIGLEWELTEAFAIGVTANLRRVERLAAGFRPGYPVDGNVPTDDVFVFGLGVVVNLSPEFLKVGAGGAAAVLH